MIKKIIGYILISPLAILIFLALILIFVNIWHDVEHHGKEALIMVGLIILAIIGGLLVQD